MVVPDRIKGEGDEKRVGETESIKTNDSLEITESVFLFFWRDVS